MTAKRKTFGTKLSLRRTKFLDRNVAFSRRRHDIRIAMATTTGVHAIALSSVEISDIIA